MKSNAGLQGVIQPVVVIMDVQGKVVRAVVVHRDTS